MKNKITMCLSALLITLLPLTTLGANAMAKVNATSVKEKTQSMVGSTKTYKNYLTLPNEWDDYGIGDPYVMRDNGRYYLYCSTKDAEVGIKAWSSTDLINWKYEGLVTKDKVTVGAYAPEVVYWNGFYYMYTSPAGNGHYALRSTSPVGPFSVMTENFGQSIDGDVFIDDDGKWYFNHAGQNGIVQNPMINPLKVDDKNAKIIDSAYMNGWTEGPSIIKRAGRYFLTYTGNHVQSDGYRVNYSVSGASPSGGYKAAENNPMLISTDSNYNGLGHSSTVMGPDMDSYYLIYHNRIDANSFGAPLRKLNIARLVFSGDRMDVVGGNTAEQPVPKLADFTSFADANGVGVDFAKHDVDGKTFLITKGQTDSNFIAEYNINRKSAEDIKSEHEASCVFSYQNDKNYMSVIIDTLTDKLSLARSNNGKAEIFKTTALYKELDFTKRHTVRVEKNGTKIDIYFDNLHVLNVDKADVSGGSIGYVYSKSMPVIGYTAFNNDVSGTSDYNIPKSVPGVIESIHFIKGYKNGYDLGKNVPKDQELNHEKIGVNENGSFAMKLGGKGQYLKYNINAADTGTYGISIMVKGQSKDAKLMLQIDDKAPVEATIPSTNNEHQNKFINLSLCELGIDSGLHNLKIESEDGVVEFKTISFTKLTKGSIDFSDSLVKYSFKNWTQSGFCKADDKGFRSVDSDNCKVYTGDHGWTDYEVSAKIMCEKFKGNADGGILFRVNNESTGYRQQVTDDLVGYYAEIDQNGVSLYKLNYGRTKLASKVMKFELNKYYTICIKVISDMIEIYVDNVVTPVLSYHDENGYLSGRVGLYSFNGDIHFKDFHVTNADVLRGIDKNSYAYNKIGMGTNFTRAIAGDDKSTTSKQKINDIVYSFDDGNMSGWKCYGGKWSAEGGDLNILDNVSSKAVVGDESWENYVVEADLTLGEAINSGIIFRVTKPGDGADEMNGYFAGFNNDGVILGKENGSWTSLQFTSMPVKKNAINHIKVVVDGDYIKVYAGDDMEKPKIIIEDDSFSTGDVGVRSHFSKVKVDNFKITNISK